MVDFKTLLSKKVEDVERPPAQPTGTMFGNISKFQYREAPWNYEPTGQKERQVEFTIKVNELGDDVDAEQAKKAKTLTLPQRVAYSVEDGQEWPLRMFLEGIGVDIAGKTLDVAIPDALNASVMFEMTQRFDKKDPSKVYNDVKNIRARE